MSYEITQHTAKTGEHYITETSKEYFQMLKAAMGAGLVVGFLCIFKVLLGKIETSYFGHAFLYSMNYAFGFITIFLLGYALATKQPAITATTIAKVLENGIKEGEWKWRKTQFVCSSVCPFVPFAVYCFCGQCFCRFSGCSSGHLANRFSLSLQHSRNQMAKTDYRYQSCCFTRHFFMPRLPGCFCFSRELFPVVCRIATNTSRYIIVYRNIRF